VFAILPGVPCELAEHSIGFAAATGAAEKHLKDAAFKERLLRWVSAG
jgi:hypothetical protein